LSGGDRPKVCIFPAFGGIALSLYLSGYLSDF
jgi:hypothetical protein